MVGIVLLGVFVLLLALGAPIAVCLGMSSVSAILVQGAGKPLEAIMSVLPRLCSSASSKFVLLGHPVFHPVRQRDGEGRYLRPPHQSGGKVPRSHPRRHGDGLRGRLLLLRCYFRFGSGNGRGSGPHHDPGARQGRLSRFVFLRADGRGRRDRASSSRRPSPSLCTAPSRTPPSRICSSPVSYPAF